MKLKYSSAQSYFRIAELEKRNKKVSPTKSSSQHEQGEKHDQQDDAPKPKAVMTLRDQITKAEILWSMKVVDMSFASSNGLRILYKSMFHGCVADQFTLGSSKVSYLIADGLAPYFKQSCVKI